MEQVLRTLGSDDINYLLEQQEGVEMKCDYCSSSYTFAQDFLASLQQ